MAGNGLFIQLSPQYYIPHSANPQFTDE